MADTALKHDSEAEGLAMWRAGNLRRYGLLITCAGIAWIAGYLGRDLADTSSWSAFGSRLLTLFATLIVAAALLRMLDTLALRRALVARADRSAALSDELRRMLRERVPDVDERAKEVDPQALIDRALRRDKDAASSQHRS